MKERGDTWTEAGQTFRWAGWHIETTKPAKLKVAYGDERLRELEARRADRNSARRGVLRRLRGAMSQRFSALG